ncbi:hypothetical protein C8Q75DRAFT_144894 [Abortiporus biennis]|nr:hypothetical protein C8Q75DRAFT_144894 [Abortiporus biennis]
MMKMTTYSDRGSIKFPKRDGFKPGSPDGRGCIAFKFNVQHANWMTEPGPVRLFDKLKSDVTDFSTLSGPAATKACWEDLENQVKLAEELNSGSKLKDKGRSPITDTEAETRSDLSVRSTRSKTNASTAVDIPVRFRSTRSSTRRPTKPPEDPEELMLVYPPVGTGAVRVHRGDINRLNDGEYLNDTVIEYGLKLCLADIREKNPELADQVYVFSTFFYKKLNVKDKEQGYSSVRKWTNKVDIFSKKYIIVPINEHLHWYLAIIVNPQYALDPPIPKPPGPTPNTRKRKRDSAYEADENEPSIPEPAESKHRGGLPNGSTIGLADNPNISIRMPSPRDEEIPDSEDEFSGPRTQPLDSSGKGEEMEVEVLLERSCSISGPFKVDERDKIPSSPQLEYPGDEPMDVGERGSSPLSGPDVDMETPNGQDRALCDGSSSSTFFGGATPESPEVELLPNLPSEGNPAPVASFYASVLTKGKEASAPLRERSVDETGQDSENQEQADNDVSTEASEEPEAKIPHVFTFDSLGSKHPQAIRVLAQYLQMEARDKQGLDIDNTTLATGKQALVPFQPNYCDCGVYLLHFVKTFLEDPVRLTKVILTRSKGYDATARALDWNGQVLGSMRETLLTRTLSLHEEWKKQQSREGERKDTQEPPAEAGTSTDASPVVEDSDDELVEVIEDTTAKKTSTPKAPKETKADRSYGPTRRKKR